MNSISDNKQNGDINFGAILQSIMLDYEQLANSHNMMLKILFKKNIITQDDWKKEIEEIENIKKENQEKVSKIIKNENNNDPKSKIIRP